MNPRASVIHGSPENAVFGPVEMPRSVWYGNPEFARRLPESNAAYPPTENGLNPGGRNSLVGGDDTGIPNSSDRNLVLEGKNQGKQHMVVGVEVPPSLQSLWVAGKKHYCFWCVF